MVACCYSFVEKDSLLLETPNNVRKGDYGKAHHDLLLRRSLKIKVEKKEAQKMELLGR